MTNEISQRDYEQTMSSGMIDVTESAEALIDIWPYIDSLVKQQIVHPYILKKQLVEKVYRSGDHQYEHIVLPTPDKNNFIVLIIERNAKAISGHHLLNLTKEYSLIK